MHAQNQIQMKASAKKYTEPMPPIKEPPNQPKKPPIGEPDIPPAPVKPPQPIFPPDEDPIRSPPPMEDPPEKKLKCR